MNLASFLDVRMDEKAEDVPVEAEEVGGVGSA